MRIKEKSGMGIGILFFCLLLNFSYATAQQSPWIYTSEEKGGIEKNKLNIDKTPWLYLRLPYAGRTSTTFWWTNSNANTYGSYKTTPKSNTETEFWHNFNDFDFIDEADEIKTWSDVKRIGTWDLSATYSAPGKPSGTYGYTFNIVPEPISSVLFMLGGATLGLKIYRTRKKRA